MGLNEDLELLEELREEGDRLSEANLLFRIGLSYSKKGDREEALNAWQAAYNICRVEGNDQGRLEVVRRVVPLLLDLDRPQEAAAGLEAFRELAGKKQDLSAQVEILELEARLFVLNNQPREAVESLIRAADICGEHQDWIGRYIMLEKAAPLLRRAGRFENALQVYTELTELAHRADDQGRLALALAGQGQMLDRLGRPDAALKALTNALEIYRMIGHKRYLDLVSAEVRRLENELAARPEEGADED